MANTYITGFPSNYKTPSPIGTVYTLLDLDSTLVYPEGKPLGGSSYSGYIIVKNKNGETRYNLDEYGKVTGIIKINDEIVDIPQKTFTIEQGNNEIFYYVQIFDYGSSSGPTVRGEKNNYFSIQGVPNKYPLKPWTNGEVMDRLLQLVEPIRQNQKPRFVWEAPKGKESAFNALAPEYTFTRLNLRECLQTIGGRIHAEPRLKTVDGKDTITFDFYGEQVYATIKNHKTGKTKRLSSYKYTTNKGVFDLEQTCTRLDSYMENLVSRVDWERATIGQPYEGGRGGMTLRTATEYQRAEETDNYYFITQYPIDRPVSFEAKTPESGTWVDITGYLYEKTVYNNLSGYQDYAPAKAVALYYEQGQKGINGFFYKVPHVDPDDTNYSIVNIVQAVSGEKITDYEQMQFRLTYVPIFSPRVGHGKQYVNDYLPLPRVMNYSQGANQVESRFYGQNIKATAQRLGNVEKSCTFNIRNANNIPKAGQLWDDNYYIATVSVEVGIDLLRVTVGLSKHFNRKSQYIGANSYRRVYEVSEVMVQERNTVYNDYLIVRKAQSESNEFASDLALLSGTAFKYSTLGLFTSATVTDVSNDKSDAEIAGVRFVMKSKKGDPNNYIFLPVVSSAFGNAMEFAFECQDNFSAGIRSDVSLVDTNWVFGTGTEYGDYYGRGYYFDFVMLSKAQIDDAWSSTIGDLSNKNDFPLSAVKYPGDDEDEYNLFPIAKNAMVRTSGSAGSYLYRKDSREKTKITYALEFVADGDDFIIGNALTEGNPLVSYSGIVPHLYVFPFRVNRFADRLSAADLSATGVVDLGEIGATNTTTTENFFRCNGVAYSGSGLSWCIALPVSTVEDGMVENEEDGEVSTFTREIGGDILIARNVDISTVDTVGDFEILLVHDLYSDYINKK